MPLPLLLALLVQCTSLWAGYPPMVPVLQPYQVASPDGTWVLDVKPGNREAAGPAATTLTNARTGEIAWKRMLPYTFWQSCVNDDGVVGGFAYTKGVMGENDPSKDAGNFIVAFLDVQGVQIHEESTRRTPSSVGMGYFVPTHRAYRLLLDGGNGRMILLMSDGLFRCYDMRTGTLEGAFSPESKGDASGYEWPDEIRFIPNTRLILLLSNSARGNSTETTSTSCIQLIDDSGRTVWAASQHRTFGADKEWPFPEFRILDAVGLAEEGGDVDPFAEDPIEEDPFADAQKAPEPSGPAAPTKVGSFDAYFGDTGEKVVFHILDSGANNGPPSYRVIECSREKWTLPKEAAVEDDPTPPAEFPAMAARQLAGFQLKRADGTPLCDIVAIALGLEDTIHVLNRQKGLIHVFDRDGKLLHVCDPGKEHAIDTSAYSGGIAVDDKGEIFVRISDGYGDAEDKRDPLAGHYLRFSPDGSLKGGVLAPPSAEVSGSIVVQPKANNLIFFGFGHEVAVTRRDKYGSRAATLTRRADGQWLEYIQDVACAPNGMIAVRDTSKGDTFGGFTTPLVYLFDSKGTPVGAIRIEELADRERVNLRPFIVSGGHGILVFDRESGMTFRFAIP